MDATVAKFLALIFHGWCLCSSFRSQCRATAARGFAFCALVRSRFSGYRSERRWVAVVCECRRRQECRQNGIQLSASNKWQR